MDNLNLLNCSLDYHIIKDCTDKWQLVTQKIDFYDICFVTKGSADYYINNVKYELKPGCGIFLPINSIRKANTFKENLLSFVDFNFFLPENQTLSLPTYFNWENNHKLLDYFQEIHTTWTERGHGYKLKCSAILNLIIYEIINLEKNKNTNIHIAQIKDYIISHLDEKITVSDIAQELSINPVYCGALFKENTGDTILSYINKLKINKAKTLLRQNDLSMNDIAIAIGLDNQYYFSKLFKEIQGVTPSKYRKLKI